MLQRPSLFFVLWKMTSRAATTSCRTKQIPKPAVKPTSWPRQFLSGGDRERQRCTNQTTRRQYGHMHHRLRTRSTEPSVIEHKQAYRNTNRTRRTEIDLHRPTVTQTNKTSRYQIARIYQRATNNGNKIPQTFQRQQHEIHWHITYCDICPCLTGQFLYHSCTFKANQPVPKRSRIAWDARAVSL